MKILLKAVSILRIIGIDPGYAIVGYGVIDYDGCRFSVAGYGAITTPAGMDFPLRLKEIYDDLNYIFEKCAVEMIYDPNIMMEGLYQIYMKN